MTIANPSRKVIDRVCVNFDHAANYHVFYRWAFSYPAKVYHVRVLNVLRKIFSHDC